MMQPMGVQPMGVQPMGVQPMGVQPMGVQPMGVQPMGVVAQPMMMPGVAQKAQGFFGAPIQVNMGEQRKANYLDYNMMPSLVSATAAGSKTLYSQNPDCSDACFMVFTCGCMPKIRYRQDEDEIVYESPCLLCCPWQTKYNDELAGTIETPNCMENGFLYCCCPVLTCSGKAKILELHRGDDHKELFTLRRELFPCWPYVDCCCNTCCFACAPCAIQMSACMNYCQEKEYRKLSQPLFLPMQEGDEEVGRVTLVSRAVPYTCCLASLEKERITLEVPATTTEKDVMNLGLVPLMFLEPSYPCGKFSIPVRKPMGIVCMDTGLLSDVEWASFKEIMGEGAAAEANDGKQ